MKIGMNLLMWTDALSDDKLVLLDNLKEWGFDAAEIPMFGHDLPTYERWGKRCDDLGLARTSSCIAIEENNPISPDPAIRRVGVDSLKKTLDCCAALGAETLIGPYHSALGYFTGKGPTDDEWKWGVESMREVAEHAGSLNIKLGLEAVNRFECYFLNCMADGARFVRDVDHPACGMMYDTFHANIEEKSVTGAIREVKDCLYHVHISENDRSTPGQGDVKWGETFDALKEVGYDGFLVVEAFGMSLEMLAAATKIWRRMFESEEQLARDALAFVKGEIAKRW